MGDEQERDRTIRRRSFLRMAGGAAAVTAFGGLGACAPAQEGPAVVEVPLESIPVGGRLRIIYGEMPVEIIRDADGGVMARSLWCTHSGCEVKWQEDRQIYFCACHDAEFDEQGKVIAGPPPRPLGQIPVAVTDTAIRVGDSA